MLLNRMHVDFGVGGTVLKWLHHSPQDDLSTLALDLHSLLQLRACQVYRKEVYWRHYTSPFLYRQSEM